jgi:hypothetical protein
MKIIITEDHLKKILKEFDITGHSKNRLNLRFLQQTSYDVVAFMKKEHNKMIIGKYIIPQDAKTTVNNIFNKINDPDYSIFPEIALVIQLYEFNIKLDHISFIGTPEEQIKFKGIFNDRQNNSIFLQTPMDERGNVSNGKFLVCIARDNIISTVFLLQNPNSSFEKLKENMMRTYRGLDDVIYINNPETQLDAYINTDTAKLNPPKDPQIPIEEPPRMSDREQRLMAYNEKMKRKFRR